MDCGARFAQLHAGVCGHPPPPRHHQTVFIDLIDRPPRAYATRGASAQTEHESCVRGSRTICCAPPAPWPPDRTPWHGQPRCSDASSVSRANCAPVVTSPPALTRPLALNASMDHAVAQHHRRSTRPPSQPVTASTPAKGPTLSKRKRSADQRIPAVQRQKMPIRRIDTPQNQSVHGPRQSRPTYTDATGPARQAGPVVPVSSVLGFLALGGAVVLLRAWRARVIRARSAGVVGT